MTVSALPGPTHRIAHLFAHLAVHLPARFNEHLSIRSPHLSAQMWVGLSLILAALVLGHLSSRARFFVKASQDRQSEAERLYELIRNTTQLDLHRKPGPQLASLIHSVFHLEAAAIFDADLNEIYEAGAWSSNLENQIRNIYVFEIVRDDPKVGSIQRVLRMGNLPIGSLLLRGEISKFESDSIACLAAITFDRYHSLANEARIESARRAEQMRTTVLDSLAHAYKTPLTAIRAASTGLAEMGSLTRAQSSLVSLIEEQAEHLNQLTTRLLQTARLDAHDLTVHAESVALTPLIEEVVASVRDQLAGISVRIALEREDLSLRADRTLLSALLTQFVDNAVKYADAASTVTIDAELRGGAVLFSVHNVGPVIPAADRERIFDRYFRSSIGVNRAPGTGIGLSIAKHAAQAHGGDVWVTSDRERGTTFFASLPTEAPELPHSEVQEAHAS